MRNGVIFGGSYHFAGYQISRGTKCEIRPTGCIRQAGQRIVIGPAVLGWIHKSAMVTQISEIGVLLLMFIAGLETDIKALNQNRNASLAVAVYFPLMFGYLTGLAIDMRNPDELRSGHWELRTWLEIRRVRNIDRTRAG